MLGLDEVNRVDKARLWSAYQRWPDLAKRALSQKLELPDVQSPTSIILAGMGGSGAACDVVADWLSVNSSLPSSVVKDYHLPGHVGKGSLVVVVSLSGETKEMVSILQEGVSRGCAVVALSSGGELETLCKRLGVPHNRVEREMVPRASLPGMVFVALRVLQELGLVKCQKDLDEASRSLGRLASEVAPGVRFRDNKAKKLAKILHGKRVVIYSSSYSESVGHHFKASMNENAKVPVDSGCYPEIFHNEIETWRSARGRAVVLLRHSDEDQNVARKLVRAKEVLADASIPVVEVREEGGLLSSLLDWCLFLDMVSIYVAVLRNIPPISTPLLDKTRTV